MKRRWYWGRVVLGVLLLGIAGLAYWIWPGWSWKIEGEKAIGFDVVKGLVYTVKSDEGKHELRGYDLWSGERRKVVRLEPETKAEASLVLILDGSDKEEMQRIEQEWNWFLLPSKRELIAINGHQNNFQLVDLETGHLIKKLPLGEEMSRIFMEVHIGIDRFNKWLVMHSVESGAISVWDLSSGSRTDVVPSRRERFSILIGMFQVFTGQIAIDSNGRYIAEARSISSDIRDVLAKKKILEHPTADEIVGPQPHYGGHALFIADGNMVIFMPSGKNERAKVDRFRLTADGSWQADPLLLATGKSDFYFVGYSDSTLVADSPSRREAEKPGWVPEMVWEWAAKVLALDGVQHRLQFWNVHTGEMVRKFSFFEQKFWRDEFLQSRVLVSENAQWLAVEFKGELTVYDVTGHRTVWCWVVVVGLVLLAAWVCWPRRVKLQQS